MKTAEVEGFNHACLNTLVRLYIVQERLKVCPNFAQYDQNGALPMPRKLPPTTPTRIDDARDVAGALPYAASPLLTLYCAARASSLPPHGQLAPKLLILFRLHTLEQPPHLFILVFKTAQHFCKLLIFLRLHTLQMRQPPIINGKLFSPPLYVTYIIHRLRSVHRLLPPPANRYNIPHTIIRNPVPAPVAYQQHLAGGRERKAVRLESVHHIARRVF